MAALRKCQIQNLVHSDLSIIIVNWNTQDHLRQCLTSIAETAQSFASWQVETVVVDNASTDDSCSIVRSTFPWVTLIENSSNLGFAVANNIGISCSRSKYVLLLNSDTILHPGALDHLLRFMEDHPRAAAIGPMLLNADGSLQPSCHPMLTPEREFWRLLFLDHLLPRATYDMSTWDPATPRPVEVIKGACLMLRREALDQVGLLDESYFMYTEEVDLCYRLHQQGWQLWWVPRARVTHFGGVSSRQIAREMYLELYRSKVRFYRKFGGNDRAQRFITLTKLAYWPRIAIATLTSPFMPSNRSRLQTFRLLVSTLDTM